MSDFIERIRDAASIEELARGLTELAGRGRRLTGICPFHTEDTASFVVYVDSGSWHCFGCGRGGSIFDFVMQSQNMDFWQAATFLANKYNIPMPELTEEQKAAHIREQEVQGFLGQFVSKSAEKLAKKQEVIDYLHSEGVTDDSINEYRIGYGVKLATGTKQSTQTLALSSGLLARSSKGSLYQPMADRIIFPIIRHGHVVQISGRAFGDDKPKYMSLPGRDIVPWNVHRLRGERCLLVEGVKDAILLEQAGFPACATIGANFKNEWVKLIGKDTECFACFDGDEAGSKASSDIADKLFMSGRKTYVINLPEGHDPASFVKAESAGAFQVLLDGSRTYIDYLIEQVPPGLNSYELPKRLELIYSRLATLPPTSHERYISRITDQLKLSKVAVKKELKDYLRDTRKRDDELGDSIDEWKIRRRTTNPIFFNPSQDYIKDTLFYTIWFEIEGLGVFRPFIITSNRECFPFTKDELLKRDMICRTSAMPSNYSRWSIGTDNPNNALDYLDGKTHIDPKDLYVKIKWYFKKFVRLPDPFYYDFFTCWCIATYHFRLYDSFGYIFINAMKRSGKTQTLSIMQHLVFNASMADAITEAVLKRRVNVDAATIIADEAEYFKAKLKDEKSMIFEVFNGGYKRFGRATMVDPDTKTVEDFCTYSPKALANTQGLYDVLADRCITLYLLRSEQAVPQFIEADHISRLQKLRDMLYCFTLEYIEEIAATKHELKQPESLPGRDWELWLPVLNISKFLDNYNVVEPKEFELSNGTKKKINTLYERMITMAIERREYRQALEEEMQAEPRIMQAIWQYMTDTLNHDDMYPIGNLCIFIKDELGFERYSTRSLSKFIFDTAKLASRTNSKDRDFQYVNVDGKTRKVRRIRLQKQMVLKRAKQLFGLDLNKSTESDLTAERDPFEDE